MEAREKLVLVDGSSFLYRAYFADKQGFTTRDGVPTGAAYILTRMLKNLVRTYANHKIIVVFDAKGPSFRQSMYSEYKATRPPMPDELRAQIDMVHQIVIAMGFPLVQVPGVEADDVIGSYAKDAERRGMDVVICTGDKDLAQLVNDHITLNDTMKDIQYDAAKVKEKYGVAPELIIDFLALKGDSSDNIPGMKGVGDKTAAILLNDMGGIYYIRDHLADTSKLSFRGASGFAKRFQEQWNIIELSYKLATIKCDVDLPISIDQVVVPQEDNDALITLYENLEFNRFAQEQRERKATYQALLGQAAVEAAAKTRKANATLIKEADESEILDLVVPVPNLKKTKSTETTALEIGAVPEDKETEQNSTSDSFALEGQSILEAQVADENKSRRKKTPKLSAPSALINNPDASTILQSVTTLNTNQDINAFRDRFKLVLTQDDLSELTKVLEQSKRFAIHIETTQSHPMEALLVGIAIGVEQEHCYYIPLRHDYLGAPEQLSLDLVRSSLQSALTSPDKLKIAYDLKSLRLTLHFANLDLAGPMADTMLMVHNCNSSLDLDVAELAIRYLEYTCIPFHSIFDTKKTPSNSISVEQLGNYAMEQALVSLRLYPILMQELKQRDDQELVEEISGTYIGKGDTILSNDMKVLDVLYNMEQRGAYLDAKELLTQSKDLKGSLHVLQESIYTMAGTNFNLSSPAQLGKVLFETLAIPYSKKDAKLDKHGHRTYSTADDVLSELVDDYEIVRKIQYYRMLSKLVTTYAQKLPSLISANTGRIHTRFNLSGTNTGRLSSYEPNLQNIPSRTREGRQIRKAFSAPEGYSLVSADYSQIELRLIAHFSRDPNLINAFMNHEDIHRATAAEVLGKRPEEITDLERVHAKATNFGLMYGMSSHGLARQTGMSRSAAKEYINKYFAKYPSIQALMDDIVAKAKQHGFITTILGHRIYIKGIQGTGSSLRAAERAAINAPMQGSAADIIKQAMIKVQEYIDTLPKDSVHLTLQVHDELLFEVRDSLLEEFCTKVKEIMENVVKLSVPLEVGIGYAKSWDEAH